MSQPEDKLSPDRGKSSRTIQVREFSGKELFRDTLDHVRIAHLTDLHFGRVTPMSIQRKAVDLVNASCPDLVLITGDFVCHSQRYLDALESVLSRIEAPTLAVLGNHDYWSGADEVAKALGRANIELLRNEWTERTVRGQTLQLVGLDDAYTGHADRDAATKGLDPKLPTIAMSHIAEEADYLWDRGISLVLSGHTHGGQITFARLHEISIGKIAGHKYLHGLYGSRKDYRAVYVGAGIGAAVIPLRLGERGKRELALFELGRAAPDVTDHHHEQIPFRGRAPTPSQVDERRRYVDARMWKREQKEARALLKAVGGRLSQVPPKNS